MKKESDDKHDAEQRMLGAIPGEPALGRGPAPGGDYCRHEYRPSCRGVGCCAQRRPCARARGGTAGGRSGALRDEPPERRLRLSRLCVAGRSVGAQARHLRERRQACHVGASACEGRPRVLRRPHRQRAGRVERLRPRGGGTARRASELQPCKRQVRADLLEERLRARRRQAAGAREPAPGVILHLRAAQQRSDLPLPALGARVRHEQPAGLLEHVPRGQRPGDDGGARDRERHR